MKQSDYYGGKTKECRGPGYVACTVPRTDVVQRAYSSTAAVSSHAVHGAVE
jgi:hypothetical protein